MLAFINSFLNNDQALIISVILPFLFGLTNYLVKAGLGRLPAARRMLLEEIVSTAVNAVEQVTGLGGISGDEKKKMAIAFIEAELNHYGVHVPVAVLDPLIEEAVYLLNVVQGKSTASAHALAKIK